MLSILKQPSETIRLPLEFGGVSTISALQSVTVAKRGLVAGAVDLIAAHSLFAGALTLSLSGGSDGERYLVTVIVDDAAGARAEQEVEVAVLGLAWVMPDGGAPMLSIAEFVQRFGIDEVVRMTDVRGDGRVGKDILVAALIDAQAIVEGYVGGRYKLPFDPVPQLIKAMVADIARGRLYPMGAPDGIDALARSAARKLEQISRGELGLGALIPDAPVGGDGAPTWFSSGRAYPDGLKDY